MDNYFLQCMSMYIPQDFTVDWCANKSYIFNVIDIHELVDHSGCQMFVNLKFMPINKVLSLCSPPPPNILMCNFAPAYENL